MSKATQETSPPKGLTNEMVDYMMLKMRDMIIGIYNEGAGNLSEQFALHVAQEKENVLHQIDQHALNVSDQIVEHSDAILAVNKRIKKIEADKDDFKKSEEAIMRLVKEKMAEVHQKNQGGLSVEEKEELWKQIKDCHSLLDVFHENFEAKTGALDEKADVIQKEVEDLAAAAQKEFDQQRQAKDSEWQYMMAKMHQLETEMHAVKATSLKENNNCNPTLTEIVKTYFPLLMLEQRAEVKIAALNTPPDRSAVSRAMRNSRLNKKADVGSVYSTLLTQQKLLLNCGIPINEWSYYTAQDGLDNTFSLSYGSISSYDELLWAILQPLDLESYKSKVKLELKDFKYETPFLQNFYLNYIQRAAEVGFVDIAPFWIRDRLIKDLQSVGKNEWISQVENLRTLNQLMDVIQRFPRTVKRPTGESATTALEFQYVNHRSVTKARAPKNSFPVKRDNQSERFTKKRTTYWCRNCSCDSCLTCQRKHKYKQNARGKSTRTRFNQLEADGIEEIEGEYFVEVKDICPRIKFNLLSIDAEKEGVSSDEEHYDGYEDVFTDYQDEAAEEIPEDDNGMDEARQRASESLVYETLLKELPSFIELIEQRPADTTYAVAAAFGDVQQCKEIAKLKIEFAKNVCLEADFIIIPEAKRDKRVILGLPLLHKLNYRLDKDAQYLTLADKEYRLDAFNIYFNAHEVMDSVGIIDEYAKKYPVLFSSQVARKPKHNFEYQVVLEGFDFKTARPFYANTIQAEHIKKFLNDALENEVLAEIVDDTTPIALAPVFPIQQQSGKVRNFSSLDLCSAYYNVPLSEKGSRIGITTIYGNYEFKKLPFGLASAPAVFTRFMRYVLKDLEFDPTTDFIQCYLDDIIVASVDQKSHKRMLDRIFALMNQYDLRLTVSKVQLFRNSIEFLGYVIRDGKRFPSPDKTSAIEAWKMPKTPKDWYSFIGFVNFLANFIPDSAYWLKPLYEYYHFCKNKKNEGRDSPVSEEILLQHFNHLKEAVKASVGLQLFDPTEEVVILTDASDLGIGAIILQPYLQDKSQLVPIQFYSKSFNPTQQRYSTLERELYGILVALSCNYLLLSHKITIYTDHQALVSISNKSNMLNTRVLRFIETLSTYPITIKYIQGKKNIADFLSRFYVDKQPLLDRNDFHNSLVDVRFDVLTLESYPKMSHLNDDDMNKIADILQEQTPIPKKYEKIIDYFLWYEDKLWLLLEQQLLEVIDFAECRKFMVEEHEDKHGSPMVLMDILQDTGKFHPQRQVIAMDVVKNCTQCDLFARFQEIPAPYQLVKTPEMGSVWHIDFVGPLNAVFDVDLPDEAVRYILVAVEYASGFCVALPTTYMTAKVVNRFLTQLMMFFPILNFVVSDNAQNFIGSEVQSYVRDCVERVNGILKKHLKQLDPKLSNWQLFLFQVVKAYNNTQNIFNTTPSQLFFGTPSKINIENGSLKRLMLQVYKDYPLTVHESDATILRLHMLTEVKALREKVVSKRHAARSALKLLNDPSANNNSYTVGEFVYVKKMSKKKKTDPSYEGPFIVQDVGPKNSYKISDLHGKTLKYSFNLSHLRPAFQHYGTPFRTIADFTETFGTDQRQTFSDFFTPFSK
ncbi:hypothetical protein CANINC_002603 [Pichia inconspicua]|uniref:Uncharacterized protein n=1 Tax=Pichia inconspicua TaxID=52247 RepID=A0A4V4NFN9_9ASCO|nr:hypothetical protein CANINC_002603 [[Candida] inconspicua]